MLRDSMTQGGFFIETRRIAFPARNFWGTVHTKKGPKRIVASRAKVAPFALCLLGNVFPKPLLPAQALWLYCESAGFVIVVGTVFIVVVIFWYDMLVTLWCAVPFQNFVIIPDM
ncbi:MAG: hypothetical protein IKH57_12360, partial [Clostridia bacterium]|nr:hypothetical protein [Clostridia bacterium]